MKGRSDPNALDVLIPNFKRRLSGVTATIVRLVPRQAQKMALAAVAPDLPAHVPQIRPWQLLVLSRRGPSGVRVWHARRNTEMLVGLILKHVLRKRLKLVFTSASQRHHTGYTRWLINRMDHLISTSEKTAEYLDHPSDVILHGIDTKIFSPIRDQTVQRVCLGLPDEVLVGCYGRIRAQKGTGDFLDAMIPILQERPDVHALIMGRATENHMAYERRLKTKAEKDNVASQVHFLPEVPVHAMADWYQVLDLFVAPQRWEGFGLTPLEAMACGVPVVATDAGAFPELVNDTVGAIVAAKDIDAMRCAVMELLGNETLRLKKAQAARTRSVLDFGIEREADALLAIYRRLLVEN